MRRHMCWCGGVGEQGAGAGGRRHALAWALLHRRAQVSAQLVAMKVFAGGGGAEGDNCDAAAGWCGDGCTTKGLAARPAMVVAPPAVALAPVSAATLLRGVGCGSGCGDTRGTDADGTQCSAHDDICNAASGGMTASARAMAVAVVWGHSGSSNSDKISIDRSSWCCRRGVAAVVVVGPASRTPPV